MNDNIKKLEGKREGIAMELFVKLKKIIKLQWLVIIVLVALLAATNIYHIYQWGKGDAVVVDSVDAGHAVE